jgi:tetratricopeptide (TPR) repeat protein
MNTKTLLISLVGIFISFIAGFLLANNLNRNEITRLQTENEQFKKTNPQNPQNNPESTLTDEEIRQKIAQADESPNQLDFQRNLGLALYRYGAMKQDANLILESTRLLKRASDGNPKDYDVLVSLGNAYFDIASMNKDNASYVKAKEFYGKALEIKPDDAEVRADYGATYLFGEPVELGKAVSELEKSLQIDAKNERGTQFLAQAYIKLKKSSEAQKMVDKLKEINPNNRLLPTLTADLSSQIK